MRKSEKPNLGRPVSYGCIIPLPHEVSQQTQKQNTFIPMRNKITHRQLGRNTAHRLALFRNMVESLVTHERIRTTLAKAKELRRHADKVVTWAKVGGSTYESKLAGFLRTSESVDKVKTVLKPRYRCVIFFFFQLGLEEKRGGPTHCWKE